MVKILALTVVQHPTKYVPVVLRPGDDLPSWAAGLVTNPAVIGDQAGDSDTEDPAEQTESDQGTSNSDDDTQTDSDGGNGRPDSSWKNDDIRDYAESRGIELGEASTKAEMLEVVNEVMDLLESDTEDDTTD